MTRQPVYAFLESPVLVMADLGYFSIRQMVIEISKELGRRRPILCNFLSIGTQAFPSYVWQYSSPALGNKSYLKQIHGFLERDNRESMRECRPLRSLWNGTYVTKPFIWPDILTHSPVHCQWHHCFTASKPAPFSWAQVSAKHTASWKIKSDAFESDPNVNCKFILWSYPSLIHFKRFQISSTFTNQGKRQRKSYPGTMQS